MDLIIVESPTKAKTLKNFLGANYNVLSSYGHIRDLPKSELGIDVENNFKVKYVIPPKARKNVTLLKKEMAKSDYIYLATDPDREGEAIAWHLAEVLELKKKKNYKRITFHEITKSAIAEALKNPQEINQDLVDAQQARRALDRLVGYKLSPFLWKKVARHLSAGRVQSVAVRLIAEREKEIKNFNPEEYWSIKALFKKQNSATEFEAFLSKINNQVIPKFGIKNKQESETIIKKLKSASYKVKSISKKELARNPLPPLTTSTLQQEASKKFRFGAKMTMRLAQDLYEKGFITYHRTDSLNLSSQSLIQAKNFIIEEWGANYYAGSPRKFKAKGRTQEAHEAIRPTNAQNTPQKLKLEPAQSKLYNLIWSRFIGSQMSQAIFDSIKIEIAAGKDYIFEATGSTLKFDGFLKVYPLKYEEKKLPPLKEQELLDLIKLKPEQHFTEPPSRYTEASLIKELEKNEIGRPSTYAPIISTIQERNYVQKNEVRQFIPTEIGLMVNDLLVEHFPEIVDIKFTAKMEKKLDKIAQGQIEWIKVLEEFYKPFSKNLKNKYEQVENKKTAPELTDKTCPQCGKPLAVKFGRFGKFMACTGFPECKYTESLENKTIKTGVFCPSCEQGEIIGKKTKKGKLFYGCSKWPDCDFALWDKPTGEKCPHCGALMVEKNKKTVCSNKNCPKEK
ncbi:MAG TPA: type I DNA topoisomerase [Candidatus Pacearchaeota archaeon]|jgi:DNA topoisomerase-1|nr:type I DNA topoisomerase [Candidatus Pacearchaeota archaeon]HRR94679.1 type I DNA topoisomerase [Candidatus Paceibacterota bacterium]HPC30359.1 type I DNA topoisomerase [Candidatus Pacearchaeota archaeon]HQG09172.1 type I DNA topoisomerase [Candidatus Pacearchaeota archaeon]HQH20398.1 type I DNA topoisomerase [Candidatus Pacearchaeota archaeon]